MRNLINKVAFLFLATGLLFSCSLSKDNVSNRKAIDGTWTLTKLSYEDNEGYFKTVLFEDVKLPCFKNSEWFFRENNSTGTYTIVRPDDYCRAGARYIRWSVAESNGAPNMLQFKFTDEKHKDISGGYGFRLNIESLSATEMTLNTKTTVDGEPITIVMNFTKTSL